MYPITLEALRKQQDTRLAELQAELYALDGVTIDTKHKTLTNRAISGFGARIDDYLSIGNALYVSYQVKHPDGHTQYASRTISAYTYEYPDGTEIGVNGFLRISRTMTPTELVAEVTRVMQGLEESIALLKSERKRAQTLVNQHNKLVAVIKKHNDGVSYNSGLARIV